MKLKNIFNYSVMRAAFSLSCATLVLGAGMYSRDTQAAEWTIAPYLWASDVGLDLNVGEIETGIDVPFNDLVDKLDTAFMGHFEGRGEKWGGFFDTIYLDLSDSTTIDFGPIPDGPIVGEVDIDGGLTMKLYELAGLYRFGDRSPGSAEFDLIFGVRLVDVDQLFILTPAGAGGPGDGSLEAGLDFSATDGFIGGRVLGMFNERWGYNLRADIGGGGTDGVFNLFGAISYTFGQTGLFSLDLGYRYMTIELSGSIGDGTDDSPAEADITMSGPVLGFIFNF